MVPKLGLGIIGTSNIARTAHIPAARAANRVNLLAIAGRDRDKASRFAEEFGIERFYDTYHALLDDQSVEAVIVALPTSLHAEWTIRALDKGKHVLCEKPLASTAAEAEAMFAAAKRNNKLLLEGFTPVFLPQFDAVSEMLRRGVIGELRLARAELTFPITDWAGDIRANKAVSGSALLESGCYCSFILRRMMMGEPTSVTGQSIRRDANGIDTAFAGTLVFPGSRIGLFHTAMDVPYRGSCEIIGTSGRITMTNLFRGFEVLVQDGVEDRKVQFPAADRFARQIASFADAILVGSPLPISSEESIGNARVLDALQRATQEALSL